WSNSSASEDANRLPPAPLSWYSHEPASKQIAACSSSRSYLASKLTSTYEAPGGTASVGPKRRGKLEEAMSAANAALGAEAGVVTVVTQGFEVQPVAPRQPLLSAQPAGIAGATRPSKFSLSSVVVEVTMPVGIENSTKVGEALAVEMSSRKRAGMPHG